MTDTSDLVEYLNKAAAALYLAVDQVVADELSPRLNEAATALEAQAKEIEALRADLESYAHLTMKEEDCRKIWQARVETAERRVAEQEAFMRELTDALRAVRPLE